MTNQLKAAEAGAFAILSPGNNLEDVDPPESLDDSVDNDEDDIEAEVVELPEYTLEWAAGIDTGEPFRTSGCIGRDGQGACNRPFGNSPPGPDIRNYPFPPTTEDVARIRSQMIRCEGEGVLENRRRGEST